MTKRDKIGLVLLSLLFAFFVAMLVWMVRPVGSGSGDPSESFFVQQRIRNLQKGN